MFKDLSSIAAQAVGQTVTPLDREGAERTANRVFKALQGMYGNLFLSKFATGKVEKGHDTGVMGARDVWAMALQRHDAGTVSLALEQVLTDFPEFPPSLPQFLALCNARKPRQAYRPATPAIGMSQELRSAYSRRAREINAKHDQRAMDKRTGYIELPQTLDGLKQAIANAVATAGGDEVAELRRLDLMFSGAAV